MTTTKSKKSKLGQENAPEQPGHYEQFAKDLKGASQNKLYSKAVYLGCLVDAAARVNKYNHETIGGLQAHVDELTRRNQMLVDAADEKVVQNTLKQTEAFLELRAEIDKLKSSKAKLVHVVTNMAEML